MRHRRVRIARRDAPPRRIVALGGGGFSHEPGDLALEELIVDLTGRERPRVCLLPTASGDPEAQIARFDAAFRALGAITSHLSLFRLGERPVAVREHLLAQDAIYVGGGSMLNLIAIWHAHGLPRVLETAWKRGIVLCGVSAGAMCWFAAGITKSHGHPAPARGLGLLPSSNCVHYSQPDRRAAYLDAVGAGAMPGGWGVDDGAALVFEGTALLEAVTARTEASACRVDAVGGRAAERPLPVRLLTGPDLDARAPDPALGELRALRTAARMGRG